MIPLTKGESDPQEPRKETTTQKGCIPLVRPGAQAGVRGYGEQSRWHPGQETATDARFFCYTKNSHKL